MRLTITKENMVSPLDLILVYDKSNIPTGAPVEEVTVSLPGVHGEMFLRNKFSALQWYLVVTTKPTMSPENRGEVLEELRRVWVAATTNDIEIYHEATDKLYYVRADGELQVLRSGYNWLEVGIAFKSHKPFGYALHDTERDGIGLLENKGNYYSYPIVTITGANKKPYFVLDGMRYEADLPFALARYEALIIDSEKMRVMLKDTLSGAISDYTGVWQSDYPIIKVGESVLQDISSNTEVNITWRDRWV